MNKFQDYIASRRAAVSAIADAAISVGMPVFPCGPTKQPMTAHGFKDASADPDIIRRLFTPTTSMIGVPTGTITGWAVIDVDCKDGAQGQKWLDANQHRLPSTRTHTTRSGGWHLIFRMPDVELRNSASRIAPGVDVRANGGYVIVPPSPGYHLIPDGPEPADMPEWLLKAAIPEPKPEPAPRLSSPSPRPVMDGNGTYYGIAALERECDSIRHAHDGTKHDTLNKAAYSIGGLVTAGELIQGPAFSQLSSALADILTHCRDQKAAKSTLRRSFEEGMGRPRDVPERTEPEPEEVHPAAQLIAKMQAKVAKKSSEPLPVSDDIMAVEGALKMLIDLSVRTAVSPQPFLALGASLAAIGALAGRKYRTPTNLRTNLSVVGIADSGGGKDHARVCVKESFFAAGLSDYLGGEDLASGASLLSSLQKFPSRLFQIDEIGKFLSGIFSGKAPTHKLEIWTNLTKLYTSAGGVFMGTEYADQKTRPRIDIHQPNACLYGVTVPGLFWSAVDNGAMQDGSLARFMIFLSPEDYPERNRKPAPLVPSDGLCEALKAIAAGVPGHDYGGNIAATMTATSPVTPYIVPFTEDAEQAIDDLTTEQLMILRKAQKEQESTAVFARLVENTAKVALIRAISRDPERPQVTLSDVSWARRVVMHCITTIMRESGSRIADNAVEAAHKMVLHTVAKVGRISKSELIKKTQTLRLREREEIISALVEAGTIVVERVTGATKPTLFYRSTAPVRYFSMDGDSSVDEIDNSSQESS